MSTFNAFPVTDASVALPPLYPSQSYINQQAAAAPVSNATASASRIASNSTESRNKPKLLYSQEHYDALSTRDGQRHREDDSKHNSSQQQLPLGDTALYGSNSFNSWAASSEQKDNEPLSASLFTPANVRQSSWMPADLPPGSPHLVNYLNADDSTADSEYGMSALPLGGESSEHSDTHAAGGHGGQYGSWQPYQY